MPPRSHVQNLSYCPESDLQLRETVSVKGSGTSLNAISSPGHDLSIRQTPVLGVSLCPKRWDGIAGSTRSDGSGLGLAVYRVVSDEGMANR